MFDMAREVLLLDHLLASDTDVISLLAHLRPVGA